METQIRKLLRSGNVQEDPVIIVIIVKVLVYRTFQPFPRGDDQSPIDNLAISFVKPRLFVDVSSSCAPRNEDDDSLPLVDARDY